MTVITGVLVHWLKGCGQGARPVDAAPAALIGISTGRKKRCDEVKAA